MNSNQAFFFLSFLTECFRPFLLQRRKIIESTISPFSQFLRSDFGRRNQLQCNCLIPFFKKKISAPHPSPKKNFTKFFPQGGRAVDPVLGEKNFWKFFFGLNRLKMVWNVKKAKKKFFRGAEFFFKKKGITKNHNMQKLINVGRAISSQPPLRERCFWVQPLY